MKKEEFLKRIENFDNIIFDYGGIFLNIDYDKAVQNLGALSKELDVTELYSKSKQVKLFSDIETGQISSDDFLAGLADMLKVSDTQKVKEAWNSMLFDIPVERVEFLKELKENKNVYMLSNINEVHELHLESYLEQTDLGDFYDHFEKVYFSHKIGMRKPNSEIFEYVLSDSNLDIQNTIFIDDSAQHVEGAKGMGLEAILLERPNTFVVG